MMASNPILLRRSSSRASRRFCHIQRTQCSFSTHQRRSFRSHTWSVYRKIHDQRKVIPARKDAKDGKFYYQELQEALKNVPESGSLLKDMFSQIQLTWDYYKNETNNRKPTGKTHWEGREYLGPHEPEVKRAKKIAERLFLTLPNDHLFQRVEVIKNPGLFFSHS